MTTPATFLADTTGTEIDWARPTGAPVALKTEIVVIGSGTDALEVALATTTPATTAPRANDVRALWKMRWNHRAAPVVLVVAHQDGDTWKASVCGTQGDPAVLPNLPLDQVERICAAALSAPDPANAERTLHRLLIGQKDNLVAGLTNVGLFASHELRTGVPARPDFADARDAARPLLTARGQDLIRGLGYTMTPHGTTAAILSTDGANRAVAVLLDDTEMFDRATDRFNAATPVAQGMLIAAAQNLPWLIITRGTQIRLYPTSPDVGVGRKGQAETYTEVDLALLAVDDAAYLHLLFSADALADHGTAAQILEASVDHAAGLGARLRTRVYEDVVPALAVAVAEQMDASTEEDLAEAYHRTLTILFRLLFVAYAEDRGLLPYQRNPRYTRKALKTLAREFTAAPDTPFDPDATDRWEDLLAVWKSVDDGNTEWDVPAYNGGLFAADADHPTGHAIARMTLTNAQIGPALRHLLIDEGEDGTLGPVDFRALTVREFGTLYEGLLESSLSIAPTSLSVDPKSKAYLPSQAGQEVVVPAGQVYFHNASGARKATGSYFTRKFAVEHLLDTALEPALATHLERVAALQAQGDEAGASAAFFDFRVADLSMGSGHFLVAAIDRIERRLAGHLTAHPLPTVKAELDALGLAAREALGANSADIEIETSALLRRQIARRCIYGIDLNLMAVELARLGIWIHTFVPGLPMSSLDHGLIQGNSLTGIGTLDEVVAILEPQARSGQRSLVGERLEQELAISRDRLLRVARTAEANKREVKGAKAEHDKAMLDAADAKALLDGAVGIRLGVAGLPFDAEGAIAIGQTAAVQQEVTSLGVQHLLYRFPEVFMRERPGFDALLGNPPWEKVQVDERAFWAMHFPGLRGMTPADQRTAMAQYTKQRPDLVEQLNTDIAKTDALRAALLAGDYPGLGSGHPDLYKAFTWRFWNLLREGGVAGLVMPRSAVTSTGTTQWRGAVFDGGCFTDVTMLHNNGGWVFPEVHPQDRFTLLAITKGADPDARITLRGPFESEAQFRAAGAPVSLDPAQVRQWGSGDALPWLPHADSGPVFVKLAAHPRFGDRNSQYRFRPVQGDFNASTDAKMFDFSGNSAWPVFKGGSIGIWNPDTGTRYASADPEVVLPALIHGRRSRARRSRSAFSELPQQVLRDQDTLACLHPRIAFADITNQSNTRTMVTALVAPRVILTHKAPYLLRINGNAQHEAYLLGVLSSIPLDWYARRYVEKTLSFEILNTFPIPEYDEHSPLVRRVVQISGSLAAVDDRYAEWATEVGVSVASVPDATKDAMIAELDAVVALLYGLDRPDVQHVFATFHRGWAYQARLEQVLAHYDEWKMKVAA